MQTLGRSRFRIRIREPFFAFTPIVHDDAHTQRLFCSFPANAPGIRCWLSTRPARRVFVADCDWRWNTTTSVLPGPLAIHRPKNTQNFGLR